MYAMYLAAVLTAVLALQLAAAATEAEAGAVWTGGDHATKVTVSSDGSYTVSLGPGSPWLVGGVNQTVVVPVGAIP